MLEIFIISNPNFFNRGYPWYPALIIDPKIPKGFIYNGVPLPVPPQDVLNLKKNHSHEPILYLVLFFDVKRTWQWLPPVKLEALGLDKSVDQAKLIESRKPADRKAVKKAYGDAMQFRKQVHGDDKWQKFKYRSRRPPRKRNFNFGHFSTMHIRTPDSTDSSDEFWITLTFFALFYAFIEVTFIPFLLFGKCKVDGVGVIDFET